MSLVGTAFVSPGRLRGVYRYLLRDAPNTVARDELETMMSPDALLRRADDQQARTRGMVRDCVREGLKLGLFTEESQGQLSLSSALPEAARLPKTGDRRFFRTVADLALALGADGEQADFWEHVAWLMTLDPRDPAGPWAVAEPHMLGDNVRTTLRTNDTRWVQVEHWAVALGLASEYETVMPDPTPFLRERIDEVFSGASSLSMPNAVARATQFCPAFDGGWASEKVVAMLPPERRPKSNQLLPATSCAWLRLHEERRIRLVALADSPDTRYLLDGDATLGYARVELLDGN
jgi:hypothetical protein